MELGKGAIIGIIVVVIVVIAALGVGLWYVGTYNSLVTEDEAISQEYAEIQNQYQRKFDLIPQLVNVTDSYLNWEASTLANITSLRTQWQSAVDSGDFEGQVNATEALDAQAAQIIITVEAYPDLNGVVMVNNLMYEISGTENRITVARANYNEAVQDFNTHIKKWPASWVAKNNDFEEQPYYQFD